MLVDRLQPPPGAALRRAVASGVAALALWGAGDARAGWSAQERLALAESPRVDAALVEALDAAPRAPVIVVLAPPAGPGAGARAQVADAVLARLEPGDLELRYRYTRLDALAGRITREGLLRLLASDQVRRVGLDAPVRAQLGEAVPMTGMAELQGKGHSGAGQVVAVIDTGVRGNHAALVGSVVAEQCFCLSGCCPNDLPSQSGPGAATDDNGHGTRVGGIVSSNGTEAPLGGAPDASLVAVKVLDRFGEGSFADVIQALNWILEQRPDVTVVNLSLGGGFYPGDCDDEEATTIALAQAIDELRARGVPTIAGSGNDGSGGGMIIPACIASAISVSAVWDEDRGSQTWLGCTDSNTYPDLVTCFANSGPTTDLFAPGALITSPHVAGGSDEKAGTSYATPMVSACAALLLAAQPGLSPDVLESALELSPTRVTDPKNGLEFPRLECAAALGGVVVPALPRVLLPLLAAALLLAARRAIRA